MKRYIVVHHSLTKDGLTVSWAAIHRYHVEERGWRDIGYHGGVELVARGDARYAYQGLIGRAEDDLAAACPQGQLNEQGLHLCFIGNFDPAPPPRAMLECGVRRFILPWMRRHSIPAERVIGHRDGGAMDGFDWTKGQFKSCPGKMFDIDLVRRMVR